ncbi:MAG: TolC family protein [Proteobacteria bacterium]|nr:TolC family protein [Pseudomonadota bacterium]
MILRRYPRYLLRRRVRKVSIIILVSAGVSGCAFYHPKPLPLSPMLAAKLTAPSRPLTLSETVAFAVKNSPNLVTEREKAKVSKAQAYAAGLLPDPQFSASVDHPTVHGARLVNGYALGLAQDLQSLLTEPSRAEGAVAKQKEAQLNLLWAEWQTIQRTAGFYVQKVYSDRKVALLSKTADILVAQSKRSQEALARHNTTIDMAGSDLSAALDIQGQRDAAERAAIAADADLKAELNLAPSADVELGDPGAPQPISEKKLKAALGGVTYSRPDLLALQAGYAAQEESVRTAILEQFPAINVGFNRASDTSNIQTSGLSVTLNIPIFGGTQAKIRTERATRDQLRAEYLARLDQANIDAWRIWRSLNLLRTQIETLERALPELRKMAETGQNAYNAGNLAPATYVLLQTTLTAQESALLDLKSTLWSDTIALRVLLAVSPLIPERAQ